MSEVVKPVEFDKEAYRRKRIMRQSIETIMAGSEEHRRSDEALERFYARHNGGQESEPVSLWGFLLGLLLILIGFDGEDELEAAEES